MAKPRKIHEQQYCSRSCGAKGNVGIKKPRQSLRMRGENNPNWSKHCLGGMDALHIWVRHRFPKTELCQRCGLVPPRDLANISQEYKEDVTDWEWLCRKCHITGDGRLTNLINIHREKMKARPIRQRMMKTCLFCGNTFSLPRRITYCSDICRVKASNKRTWQRRKNDFVYRSFQRMLAREWSQKNRKAVAA